MTHPPICLQDKRLLSFIAKADKNSKRHDCFAFLSDNAEQIALTIGEAFDLAYKVGSYFRLLFFW